MNNQVLKNGLIEFIKNTKNNKNELFTVRYNDGHYWIFNGLLLNTNCFNLVYAVKNNKVKTTAIKKDEVYTINVIDKSKHELFNLKNA